MVLHADLTVPRGTTYIQPIALTIPDPDNPGAFLPRPVDGWHARMQVREDVEKPILLDLDDGAKGGLLLEEGRVTFTIEADQSTALPIKTRRTKFDLELFSGTVVERIVQGTITFDPEITR